MHIDKLFQSFARYQLLNKREKEDLSSRLTEKKIRRRQYILEADEISKQYTFVAEGCFRTFSLDRKFAEHNLQFAGENDWIMILHSFFFEKPAGVYVEAMEPSIILQIGKSDLLDLFVNNPKYDRYFRVIVENNYTKLENRILEAISSSADQRYHNFLANYSTLAQKIPDKHIASYLGITPESLSRIRKQVVNK